jgi:adenylate kinase
VHHLGRTVHLHWTKRCVSTSTCTTTSTTTRTTNTKQWNQQHHKAAAASANIINFALIGPPGSGKGTYGSILATNLKCHLVTVGNVLRQQVELNTDIGKVIGDCQRQGRLVDDAVVSHALMDHLTTLDLNHDQDFDHQEHETTKVGFILDGYPRTLEQAKLIQQHSSSSSSSSSSSYPIHDHHHQDQDDDSIEFTWPERFRISFGVSIDVPDDICLSKMLGRRHCTKCQIGFNVTDVHTSNGFVMPPKLPDPYPCNKCDMDKDWSKREDDTEEIIARRIHEYHLKTAPVADYYREKGALLSFVPYKGIQDTPLLETMIRDNINS